MSFDNWKTPAPIDTEAWSVTTVDSISVHLQKHGKLINYTGTPIQFSIDRVVTILDAVAIEKMVGTVHQIKMFIQLDILLTMQ